MPKPKLALVGAQTLLGREVNSLAHDFTVLPMHSTDAEGNTLLRDTDEIALLSPLDSAAIAEATAVVLTGDLESTAKVRKLRSTGLIDLTGLLAADPRSRIVSPLSDRRPQGPSPSVAVIAHPAATMLAWFLSAVEAVSPMARSVAHVFLPASEYGVAGVTELQQQTTALLSFQKLDQKIFDAQSAFTLLAALGPDAPQSLDQTRLRLTAHLESLTRNTFPFPALQLIQAPVFHGLSISLFIEFRDTPDLPRLLPPLTAAGLDIRDGDLAPPDNVSLANQDGVAVGAIRPDPSHPRGLWFWLAADNHRLAASGALAIARQWVQS